MATYYIDPEGGNNSNDGTSFANRKKTFSGLTPAAGDEFRFIGSPDPTTVGTGKIQKLAQIEDWGVTIGTITYSTTTGDTNCYYSGGSDSGGVSRGHNLTTGDTIQIAQNTDSNGNINGTWEVTVVDSTNFKINGFTATSSGSGSGGRFANFSGARVKLNSAVTQTIASTGPRTTPWKAAHDDSDLTFDTNTGGASSYQGKVQEHDRSDNLSSFNTSATGKHAYYELPSTLDLSGYQQISFLAHAHTSGYGFETGKISLRLCTDTQGNTSVHTIDICNRGGGTKGWFPVVKDFGSALNSSIKSVAVYVDATGWTSSGLRLSNIIACKASSSADSITHRSLIGLNTTADPDWYPIRSIDGTRVMLNAGQVQQNADLSSWYYIGGSCAWSASNNSASIKKRETVRMPIEDLTFASGTVAWFTIEGKNGSTNNRISVTGGWDRSSMSSQSLELSFLDGVTNVQKGFYLWASSRWSLKKLGFTRFGCIIKSESGGTYTEFNPIYISGCGNNEQSNAKTINITQGGYCPMKIYGASNNTGFYFSSSSFNYNANTESAQTNRSDHYWRNVCSGDTSSSMSAIHFNTTGSETALIDEINISHGGKRSTNAFKWGDSSATGSFDVTTFNAGYNVNSERFGFNILGGTNTIGTVNSNHQNPGVVEGGKTTIGTILNDESTFYQPGTYPGAIGESLTSQNGAEVHVLGTNACTLGSRVKVRTAGRMYLNNTTITYHYGGKIYNQSNGGYAYLRNSGGYNYYNSLLGKIVEADTSTRHTASGFSWKVYQNAFEVARIPVKASSLVTVSVWIYPSTSSMTDLGLKVGGTSIGIADAQSVSSSLSGSTWTKQTLTFTPANAGIAKISLTSGNGNAAYFDDMEASQA